MQERDEWNDDALACNDAILREDPSDEAAVVRRARCLRALGRLDEALESLEALVERDPDNSVARSQASKVKRRVDARRRAEQLLAEDAAKLIRAVERAKKAERDYDFQIEARRLLADRDRTTQAACALGAAQRHAKDLDGALHTYGGALAADDSVQTNAMAHVGLAGALRDLGRLDDAEARLRAVLAAHRSDHHAQVALAAVLMDRAEKRGRRDTLAEARRLLGAAWAAHPGDPVISAAYARLTALE